MLTLACGGKTGLEVDARPEDPAGPPDAGVDAGDQGPLPTLDCLWLWGESLTVARAAAIELGPAAVAAEEPVAMLTFREDGVAAGRLASTAGTPRLVAELEEPVFGDRVYGLTSGFMMAVEGDATCTFLGWSTRGTTLGFGSLGSTPCLFGEPRGDQAAFARRSGNPAFLLELDARGRLDMRATYSLESAPGRLLDFIAPVAAEGDEAFVVERADAGSRVSRVGRGSPSALSTANVRAVAPDPRRPALLALVGGPGGPAELLRFEGDVASPLALPAPVTEGEPPALLAASDTQALLFDAELALWAVPLQAGGAETLGPLPDVGEGEVRELQLVVRPGGDEGGAFFTLARDGELEARWRTLICER